MYNKTIWKDRVVDPVSGAVVQEGTFMSAEHFNNIEDGIAAVDSAIADISGGYEDIEEALETGVGTTVSLTLNQSTFVLNLALKNSKGTKISEQSVDLPIESMIVNAEYVASTKSLVLTLQSGSTVTVPLSGLISGLVNDTRKVAGIDLKDDITVSELKTALDVDDLEQNKVNKTTTVNGKALSSNITLAGSDLKLNATSYTKDSTSKAISKDTKVDEAVAQIEYRVDKKVDKATASTSQYTTSTVTVPACLGYAGIKMVGGKTKKSQNLIDVEITSASKDGITLTNNGNGTYTVNGTATTETWFSAVIDCSQFYGKRLKIVGCPINITYDSAYLAITDNATYGAADKGNGTIFAPTGYGGYDYIVQILVKQGTTLNNALFKPMLTYDESATYNDFEPYGKLWNGAVEKIVSQSKNIFNNEYYNGYVETSTLVMESLADTVTAICKIEPNKEYTITSNGNSDRFRVVTFAQHPTAGVTGKRLIVDNNSIKTYTFTSASDENYVTVLVSVSKNNIPIQVELGATSTAYSPYNKTTISVPDAIKNLPDYGCSVGSVYNWIDFESGVYHHNVGSIYVKDMSFSPAETNTSNKYRIRSESLRGIIKSNGDISGAGNLMCAKYETITAVGTWLNSTGICTESDVVLIYDEKYSAYSGYESFKNDNSDMLIVYELATPELIPISTFIPPVSCEEGGTITLQNPHSLDVPNKIVYKKEVI